MNFKWKKHGKLFYTILLVPFISIIFVVGFRYYFNPSNKEIIDKVNKSDMYSSKVEYIVRNSKDEYKENAVIYYSKDYGMRVEFSDNRIKIYENGYISMDEDGDKYEINRDLDNVYPLVFISNILSNELIEEKDGTEEWGDKDYIEIKVNLPYKNKHVDWAKIFIDKKERKPIVTKIYDENDKERVIIKYKDFEYLNNINKELF